ncbi:phage major capsid protein, P2 family, partial [Escherichia coli]|nr:phage major capsid protein, P2 family [Escherichia coli]
VMDATNNLIEPWYQEDPDLVVIVGRQLLADKYFPIVNKEQDNSEKIAADLIISQKRMGGLQAVRAPFFPANALLITRLDNLSIYWQEDTRRRSVIDNPKRDRIENFESVNEAYVVEDY